MIDTALKEWSAVCDALADGRQAVLLRKGGIHEAGGPGVFELEHRRFVLFPSWSHQDPAMVKPAHRDGVEKMAEPGRVTLGAVAETSRVWCVQSRAQLDGINHLHIWDKPYIDMRWHYKPDRPLYLIAVRVAVLAAGKTVTNHAEYAGCRSWVPLRPGDGVDAAAAVTAMDDDQFQTIMDRLAGALG